MPHRVVKRSGPKPYKIVAEFNNGLKPATRTVGAASTLKKAKMSAGIRDSEEARRRR